MKMELNIRTFNKNEMIKAKNKIDSARQCS